jgi:DNA repair protein RecN (Recombination protein N)
LTGETGAGKSLLVGALAFLLGERADASRVRAGATEAIVEGIFELPPGPARDEIAALLEEKTGSSPEDGVVALSRVLDRQGRARAYANNRYLTRDSLREISSRFVTLHGQKENSTLAKPAIQRDKLDAFSGLLIEREKFARARAEASALYKELQELRRAERERLDRLDLLRFQTREIQAARLTAGELGKLSAEYVTLTSAERIRGVVASHLDALQEAEGSALERLTAARKAFEELRAVAPALGPIGERLDEARWHAEDAAREARALLDGLDADPARLAALSDRMDKIQRILDRFHVDEAGAIELLTKMENELSTLEGASGRAEEIERALASKLPALRAVGAKLTAARVKGAPDLAKEVKATLAGLGMQGSDFRVGIETRTDAGADGVEPPELVLSSEAGFDNVVFELAPNPGEPFQPLGDVASGGELARVALAIESACADVMTIPTILFDEIDENVGGRLGPALGGYLHRTAKSKQILVVTHLAGVAAHADRHLWVSKRTEGGRTHTLVRALDGEERVPELAAMMTGDGASATARADARALLTQARGAAVKTKEVVPAARKGRAAASVARSARGKAARRGGR